MTPKRMFYVLMGVVSICVISLIAATYIINGLLHTQANSLATAKANLTASQTEQTALITAQGQIKRYSALYSITQSIVPENKDQAQSVREIVDLATADNITLGSISFPASTLGISTTPVSSTATTSSGISAAQQAANQYSQLTPVPNIPGVYTMPITVSSTPNLVTFPQFISFLQALEQNRQTALVSGVSITPNPGTDSSFTFSLTLNVYIKPQ